MEAPLMVLDRLATPNYNNHASSTSNDFRYAVKEVKN